MANITRYRGDTVSDQILVKDSAGVAVNVTGFTFKLTVNTVKDPPDITTQLFQIVGVIVDGPAGSVKFTPTAPNADQAIGKYFYDIQMTDGAGLVQTIAKGGYAFTQDITK